MVAEPWILKMGNQVSHNLKHAFLLDSSSSAKKKQSTKKPQHKDIIGILSFEVANVMSKTVHLHKSLTDTEVTRLRNEILKSDGVNNLVSSDETYLLELVLSEKLEDLNRIVAVVSRLGKKCNEPALQGFEHVFGDIMSGVIDVKELGFLVKDMDSMIRKIERYVNFTSNLYTETQVLSELEQSSKKFQQNQHEESRRVFEQKLLWQRQDVRHLKDVSLWNQTYDKIVGLLARTICTIYARLRHVFGDSIIRLEFTGVSDLGSEFYSSGMLSGPINPRRNRQMACKPMARTPARAGMTSDDMSFPCGASPGRLFTECLLLSSSTSLKVNDEDDDGVENEVQDSQIFSSFSGCQRRPKLGISSPSRSQFSPKLLLYAPNSTIGGSALALHYSNIIIIIEKLLRYPHLVGGEARDDLYEMLPTSLRTSLKKNLKAYAKNMAIYDAPLAHEWKERLDRILKWLAPLAHNMIRWQTERNLEQQQQIISRTNVLLLQTLYFADREKTEAAICELLVGLNYICRYEHQQNALLDCASSFDFDDCVEWRWQDPFL